MINQFIGTKKIAANVTAYINEYIKDSIQTKVFNSNIENIFYTVDIDEHRYGSYLCVMFCQALGGEYKRAIPVCASLELLHAHFLITDDIVDGSTIRRGDKTSYLKFGLPVALFSSDLLFSLSMENLNMLITEMNYNPKLVEIFIVKSRDVNIGQLLDHANTEKASITYSEYVKCVDLKVGSLVQLSCLSGMLLGDFTQEDFVKINKFGKYFGRAFQIYDDLIDLIYEKENQDIINRNKTFPFVYLTNSGSLRNKKTLLESYEKITNKDVNHFRDILIELIEEENIISIALDEIKSQISKAQDNLKEMGEIKELTNLCSHLVSDYKNKSKEFL